MKHGMLIAAVTIGLSAFAQNAPKKPAGEFARMSQEWVKAVMAKDAAKLASFYAEDALLMPPNQEPIKGRAAIEKFYRDLTAVVTDAKLTTKVEERSGPIGYEVGEYTISMKGSDGKMATETGKYVEVYKIEGQVADRLRHLQQQSAAAYARENDVASASALPDLTGFANV